MRHFGMSHYLSHRFPPITSTFLEIDLSGYDIMNLLHHDRKIDYSHEIS